MLVQRHLVASRLVVCFQCLFVLGLTHFLPAVVSGEDSRPNILFIMTDQQHAGMMSCTGNPYLKTPAMDSLARDGIRFTNAYAANPVCVPSRIGMATGVMPGRLGVFNNGMKADVPHDVDAHSLGKLIKRAGYDTFYGGKVHMCPELSPINAGYDEYFKDQRDGLPAACIEFIERKRDNPFFVVASFINPHDICFAYSAHKGSVSQRKAECRTLISPSCRTAAGRTAAVARQLCDPAGRTSCHREQSQPQGRNAGGYDASGI